MKYVYDTNVVIYYLAGESEVFPFFAEDFLNQNEVLISPIVRIELLSFSQLSEVEVNAIEDLLSQFRSVRLSREVEDLTILIKRQGKIKLPDAVIAATALHESAWLVTGNEQDFRHIPDLSIQNPWLGKLISED